MKQQVGQSFLALVLLMGGIVAIIGVTMVFLSSSFVDSSYGYQASTSAAAAAISGAEDALLQLERGTAPGSYSFVVGSTTVAVTITQNTPSANFMTILSQATVSSHTRAVNVVVSDNATTSQISIVSWQEIQ